MNFSNEFDSLPQCDEDSSDEFEGPKKKRFLSNQNEINNLSSATNSGSIEGNNEEVKKSTSKTSFGKKYLLSMGYQEGRGLGKHQDGIVEPVEASKQKGRRGLGFKANDLKSVVSKYDPTLEKISVDEEVIWLDNEYPDTLNKKLLESWVKTGLSLESITSDSLFCKSTIIDDIFSAKNVLDLISPKEMLNGKRRSNPFESIQQAIFLNRAAMKMANLDAILDKMFTEPKDLNGEKMVTSSDLLYFADVCAGPGGFSEYILYRKKWHAKGFGFTLRNEHDFLLDEFCAGPSETFEPHYGARGDGNIFFPENITSFRDHVLKNTDGKGVHFMMADGGVQIDEKHNDQELICKKLYLCQCLMALYIVRPKGHFVVKLFDLFTVFSIGLIYLMYRSFTKISIIKPNTSRPANSERYLVCKWKRDDCCDIANHLFEINNKVPQYSGKQKEDVLELVPVEILLKDTQFYQYITSSNEKIGENQIISLIKLATFSENVDLKEELQQELRQKCLEKWNIPDAARAEPKKYDANTKCKILLGSHAPCDLNSDIKKNTIESFEFFKQFIVSIYNWHCVVISSDENHSTCTFYLGLGRSNVHKFSSGKWKKWNDQLNINGLCLPANTLVYGELVQECIGEGKSQRKAYAFHIIDGLFLGGEDIRRLPFEKRWETCRLFAKSLCKEHFPIRVKNYYPLPNIDLLWKCLTMKSIKSFSAQSVCVPIEENTFWKAGGVIFIRDTKGSWNRFLSSKCKLMYFDNRENGEQIFEESLTDVLKMQQVYADFNESYQTRLIWWWDATVLFDKNQSESESQKMKAKDLTDYVARKKIKNF